MKSRQSDFSPNIKPQPMKNNYSGIPTEFQYSPVIIIDSKVICAGRIFSATGIVNLTQVKLSSLIGKKQSADEQKYLSAEKI